MQNRGRGEARYILYFEYVKLSNPAEINLTLHRRENCTIVQFFATSRKRNGSKNLQFSSQGNDLSMNEGEKRLENNSERARDLAIGISRDEGQEESVECGI